MGTRRAMRGIGASQNRGLWVVLLLLLAAVLVPTACVLWFMSAAMQNVRLAVRQKLADAYRPQLTAAAGEVTAYWKDKAAALAEPDPAVSAAQIFADLVRAGVCDSVVIYGASGPPSTSDTSGERIALEKKLYAAIAEKLRRVSVEFDQLSILVSPDMANAECPLAGLRERRGVGGSSVWVEIDGSLRIEYVGRGIWSVRGSGELGHVQINIGTSYPPRLRTAADEARKEPKEWVEIRPLEYELSDPQSAASAYAGIAGDAAGVNIVARALQAQARCLARAGEREAAIKILAATLADPEYRDATDPRGRLIAPNAQLLALELMAGPSHPNYAGTFDALLERLNGYGDPALPSSQRRFLMRRLQEIVPDCPPFPTLLAEDLAADYLQTATSRPEPSRLLRTPLDGVWQFASPDRRIIALFREESFLGEIQSLVDSKVALPQVAVELLSPTKKPNVREPFLATTAGEHLPGWQLSLYLQGTDPFAAAADRQIATYLWTGVLVVIVISIIALLVGRYLLRQIKFTRLKNDFIATVSHELKTPLSSMRVLVDTLLEGNYSGQQQAREYLVLVARENVRLSRLIDNFLTFSRMERNKRAFELAEVKPEEVVNAAAEVVTGRFESHGFQLDVEIAPGLSTITGDRDALVTVLLNLLDNAYKYSENDGHIALRAYEADSNVCFEVQDEGIGLSRRAARRVFDRFYQVDQSLSRTSGGCGLGLSIVKFIVDAHGGSIDVQSQPGKGSTFTVRLPVVVHQRE